MDAGGQTLIVAPGGLGAGAGAVTGADPNAAIARRGGSNLSAAGEPAFGATFCPGPDGDKTGRGANWADPFGHAFAGYVLLTW